MKVLSVAKEVSDKFVVRSIASVVALEKVMACKFDVCVTPLCSTTIDDKALLVLKANGAKETANMPIGIRARTQLTTRLDRDDVVCENRIGDGSFGVAFRGRSWGTTRL